MNAPLSVGVTLIVACVSGFATWHQDPSTREPATAGIARAARGFLDSLPAQLRSSAQRALDDTVAHVRERTAFGTALDRKQAVRHRVA